MVKSSRSYRCENCGAIYSKWTGRCDSCNQWDTIKKIVDSASGPASLTLDPSKGTPIAFSDLKFEGESRQRIATDLSELDRVLGGGIVPASAILVGGDPGIGKSTLLLQAAAAFSDKGTVFYVSGEEAQAQIKMRAARLGISDADVQVAAATNLRDILATLEKHTPDLIVIDSIQTMWSDRIESAPGSLTQVRAVAHEIVRYAKQRGAATFLVGHVTKEGQIAGPRVVEHLVDTVLYFEGDRGHQFRILRSVKNRFGPADEIGVFEMTSRGLNGVDNPSSLFLSERDQPAPGSVVFAGVEGTRPLLVEIQALVAQSAFSTPRRSAIGWDSGRMAMILAVLEARCDLEFAGHDVYLNVAGGLRITEPAADLAVAAALISARNNQPFPANTAMFGEISLSGALRPVSQPETRIKEAAKLGFERIFLPDDIQNLSNNEISAKRLQNLAAAVAEFGSASTVESKT